MVQYSLTKEVNAPREKVFQRLTEVERLPEMFPDMFKRMEVVGKEGESRIILCDEVFAGRHFRYKMKENQAPPARIEHHVFEGSGKGSTETLTLEEIPSGTRVTLAMEAKGLAAVVLGRLFKKQFHAEMTRIFEGYIKVIEATA